MGILRVVREEDDFDAKDQFLTAASHRGDPLSCLRKVREFLCALGLESHYKSAAS